MVKPTTFLAFIQLGLLFRPSVGLPIGGRTNRELCKRFDGTVLGVALLAATPVWGYCCLRLCALCVKPRTAEECDLEAGNPDEHQSHSHSRPGMQPQSEGTDSSLRSTASDHHQQDVKSQPSANQGLTASNLRPPRPPRTVASSPNLRGGGHMYYPGESPSGPSSKSDTSLVRPIRPQRSITWADECGDASSLATKYRYDPIRGPSSSAGSSRTLLPSDGDRSRNPERRPAKVRKVAQLG